MEEKQKKKRSPNFSTSEVDLLCDLVMKYSSVIESKQSDAFAWKEKLDCWSKLTNEFNLKNSGLPRTVITLRGKYETFKKELRKKAARHRQALYKTGGGEIEVPFLTPSEEKIYNIIYLSVNGLSSRFDDDTTNEFQDENSVTGDIMQTDGNTNAIIIQEDERSKINNNTFLDELIFIELNNNNEIRTQVTNEQPRKVLNQLSKPKQTSTNTDLPSKGWNPNLLKTPAAKSLQVKRNKHLLTKIQASQKVNILAESKRELVNLQIEHLRKSMEGEEKSNLLKLKKAEEELKSAQLDVQIKEIQKQIEEETLRKLLLNN